MQQEWAGYEFAAKQILANPDYGFFLIAEVGD